MQFSETWLRSLVNPALNTQELGHLLTMAGLEVEALEPVAPAFDQVVVAEILSAEKHPNADRLQVCQVNVGESQPLTIVCGAPNARAGLKTACALVGAVLPGDFQIKQAKVRDVASFGMLCSSKELGIAGDAAGIMELPTAAPVGQPLRQWLNLDDHLITLKLTPNRGDCLSLAGIAREVAALAAVPFTPVDCAPVAAVSDATYPVGIAAEAACPRYCGRVIRGIDAGAVSPAWMVERLERSGLRAIHPVVDVTNYVLLELGQPMHGFDLAKLQGGIQVRRAKAGEPLALLNDQTIALSEDTLVIADDSGALALAGIMGGASSAVSGSSTDIFLEAAHFDPDVIAGRARRYGLSTDSSHRFERGVDPELPRLAMERATRLILDICGGECGPECGPISEAGPGVAARAPIAFRPARVRRLLGFDLADATMRDILQRLDLHVAGEGETWTVTAPSHRFDITGEVDLIEEIARVHGYDAIPVVAPRGQASLLPVEEGKRSPLDLKKLMVARGYQEIITYSFISDELDRDFRATGVALPLLNPIASQMGVMRGSLMGGLMQALKHNLNHGQERLRLFEIGRAFLTAEADAQPRHAAGLAYGAAHAEQWGEPARGVDFFDIKADVEALVYPLPVAFTPAEHPALHPGQCARISLAGEAVGWLGSLHPRLVQSHGLARAPILFELDLSALLTGEAPRYQGVPRLPAVRRDIAVVVDEKQPLAAMLNTVRAAMPALVSDFSLFDVYQGQGVEQGKKSLAFKMLLQHTQKTLTESEIESAVQEVVGILSNQFNASLRR
ncbi:MAG: phenylalanine--tRNA ligase subunit beta [Pseudomonadota bacterium]|nr:phenylalanine--tRNA ligase subunit beta [Pseudomonadota bacterium]